jgi:hypothetical protein
MRLKPQRFSVKTSTPSPRVVREAFTIQKPHGSLIEYAPLLRNTELATANFEWLNLNCTTVSCENANGRRRSSVTTINPVFWWLSGAEKPISNGYTMFANTPPGKGFTGPFLYDALNGIPNRLNLAIAKSALSRLSKLAISKGILLILLSVFRLSFNSSQQLFGSFPPIRISLFSFRYFIRRSRRRNA